MSIGDSDTHKQEGWVKFRRKKFQKGFIDHWVGDCASNPNAIGELNFHLNMGAEYFRLNGVGEWLHKDDFVYGFVNTFKCDRLYFTSDEIWNSYIVK